MCGVYEYGAARPDTTAALVERMRDTMVHRGPDDAGVYVSDDRRIGLGNRRLSIVDLSAAGHIPMPNDDGRVWIAYNGEVYNHERLRPALIEQGYRFRSRTDTETILRLYEARGLDFVHDLEGDFAIAIWDANENRLVLARDRVGVKPLYYAIVGGRLIFASEIKAILEHPAVSRDIDEGALYHYLTFLTTPAPMTLFAGIQKLPAGCMLTCDARGDIKVTRYWDAIVPQADAALLADEEATSAHLLGLLNESIEKRMMSDVPFGVFLSGGVDSTANVALMARLTSRPVRTYTVGFHDNDEFNELAEARDVAREFATEHHEVIITQQQLIDFLPDLIFHQDEPIADPVCVPLYYLAKLARESGTTVVQVGEGADELFCGYADYKRYLRLYDGAWRHLSRLPRFLRRAGASAGQTILQAMADGLPSRWHKMAPDLLRRLAAGEPLFWSGAFVFDEVYKRRLLTPAALERLAGLDPFSGGGPSSYAVVRADLERLLKAKPQADQLEQMIYLELKLRLPELLLMRVDKMTMATSVEARVPFLDHKLVEFAMSLPRDLKLRDGETKYILKRALKRVIPDRVIHRRKQGFGAPINQWMLDRMGQFVEHTLMHSPLRKRGLFDYEFIARLLAEHRAGRVNYSFFLWSLLNLSLWYEQWIDGRGSGVRDRGPAELRGSEVIARV
ncbi:MAG: asparagine synthase (glutamine-hydrolyzing) [Blastocatellia bacterium]